LPWQSSTVVHWKDQAREDWKRVIQYLETTYGVLAARSGTAVRFRWAELEVAHTLPPQPAPLFGVAFLPTSMLILRVDLAFQVGDLWTVVDAPLSVAVFPTFTDVALWGSQLVEFVP